MENPTELKFPPMETIGLKFLAPQITQAAALKNTRLNLPMHNT